MDRFRVSAPLLLMFLWFSTPAFGQRPTRTEYRATPYPFTSSFVANRGQFASEVKFQYKTADHILWLTTKGLIFDTRVRSMPDAGRVGEIDARNPNGAAERYVFAADFVDAHLNDVEPLYPFPGVHNFLVGANPSDWKTGIPQYAELVAHDIWPSVDLKLFPNGPGLEQEFLVQPGGDPTRIHVSYRGTEPLRVDADGSLLVTTRAGQLRESPPHVYQDVDGRRISVDARFRLTSPATYEFALGQYNTALPLVIDPTLLFSTFLGGNGDDQGNGVAIDASGNIYITGRTSSSNFPTTVGQVPTGYSGLFVTKLSPLGNSLIYSTVIQSPTPYWDDYYGAAIAVDRFGSAYVAGWASTQANPYPTTPNRFQPCGSGIVSLFVTRMTPAGDAVQYSSCLGGDYRYVTTYRGGHVGIAVDDNGNAYVAASNSDCSLPTTDNAFERECASSVDAFLAQFDTTASGPLSLPYATYVGGGSEDIGTSVALDGSGNVFVAGFSNSPDFPTTAGAFQQTSTAGTCASVGSCFGGFIAKIDPHLSGQSSMLFSTHLSGDRDDFILGLATDQLGAAYVTGYTTSTAFPVTDGAFQTTNLSAPFGATAFVTKLSPSGSTLSYSTYLGGQTYDVATAIAVDASQNAYVVGYTQSAAFPITNPVQGIYAGNVDAFATEINSEGSALVYSTFLGGKQRDQGEGVAVDPYGNATITGMTQSGDFPTLIPFQAALAGSSNAFVSQIGPGVPLEGPTIARVWPPSVGNAGVATISVIGSGFAPDAMASLRCPGHGVVAGSNVTVSNDSGYLTATFDTDGVGVQKCDLIVENPNGSTFADPQAVSIEQGGAPELWVDVVGWSTLRAGRPQQYFIVYGNRGNLDAPAGVGVWAEISGFLEYTLGPDAPASVALSLGADKQMLFELGPLAAGGSGTIAINVAVPDDPAYAHQPFELKAWMNH